MFDINKIKADIAANAANAAKAAEADKIIEDTPIVEAAGKTVQKYKEKNKYWY
jgi:hypothetical protein